MKEYFEWYVGIVGILTRGHRVNIHLLNKGKFEGYVKMYLLMIRSL